ncbi:MAG: hypothetical protein P4M11_02645, partial [Candidatus Pacebacteria bacterium]|nr:hypothetical protein [Candidatus Paceibacterota bacterium]
KTPKPQNPKTPPRVVEETEKTPSVIGRNSYYVSKLRKIDKTNYNGRKTSTDRQAKTSVGGEGGGRAGSGPARAAPDAAENGDGAGGAQGPGPETP